MIYVFENTLIDRYSYIVRAEDVITAIGKLLEMKEKWGGTLRNGDYNKHLVTIDYPGDYQEYANLVSEQFAINCFNEGDLTTIRRF